MRLRVARKVLFSAPALVPVRFTTALAAGKRWRKWDRRNPRAMAFVCFIDPDADPAS